MDNYFQYGEKEIAYLKHKDKRLSEIIDKVGRVDRPVIPDLFTALVHAIVGQQISTKVHGIIWRKLVAHFGHITPINMVAIEREDLRSFGLTYKKVDYIQGAARKILNGTLNLDELSTMKDEEVCERLMTLNGIGQWTAEMLLIHSMQRPNVLSFGDLGVQRGLRMIYHHRKITRKLFEKYRRRFTPYNSVVCIYLWEVAGGAVEGLKDYAPQKIKKTTNRL